MQKEIQLTDKTLLVVSVPEDASDLTLPKVGIVDLYFQKKGNNHIEEDSYISIGLPSTGYELLGIYPELTEEMAKMVVDDISLGMYVDYLDNVNFGKRRRFDTSLESFQSLMEIEKCYTVNPYGEKPKFQYEFGKDGPSDAMLESAQDDFDYHSIRWHEAQQTTFSKYAILIKSK